ncbi:PRC-barrel domain containing protein [Streptomyces sp. NPDC057540]|uniref:PRC-barrel domain containing protein n=1 Tax=Streptomyces sp. NPDC057540 TaxID=3346160 RepID=UPI0036776603
MTRDVWTYAETATHATQVDVTGYEVECSDGGIGKVDRHSSEVGSSHLVVDTGPWIIGRQVVIPGGVVTAVDLATKTVHVNCTREQIKNAPEFVPGQNDDETGRHKMKLVDYYLAFFH